MIESDFFMIYDNEYRILIKSKFSPSFIIQGLVNVFFTWVKIKKVRESLCTAINMKKNYKSLRKKLRVIIHS
jgi:hypothetical protein